jgi:hypothetical protein
VSQPTLQNRELPIVAFGKVRNYRLNGERSIVRRNPAPEDRYGRMREVFKS